MARKVINIGSGAGTGDGAALRQAGDDINSNLTELYNMGGQNNARTGVYAAVLGGSENTVSGDRSAIGGGMGNIIGGARSFIPGGQDAATTRFGQVAWGSGKFASAGDAQAGLIVLRRQVTGTTPLWLTANGGAEGANNIINIADHTMIGGRLTVIAKQVGSNAAAIWRRNISLVRSVGTASTVLFEGAASPGVAPDASIGAGANWRLDCWGNTDVGTLGQFFTGSAGMTVNVVAMFRPVETITVATSAPPPTTTGMNMGFSIPFGELYNGPMTTDLDEIASIGGKHVRIDYWWNEIEYNSGSFDWASRDSAVNAALARGIGVIGILLGTPGWAANMGGMNNADVRTRYGQFAFAAAQYFAGRVMGWELGNEVNNADFWGGPPDMGNYCDSVRKAYPQIKSADPASFVITGGPSSSPEGAPNERISAPDWFNGLYDYGAQGYFDMIGCHPYSYPLYPGNTASYNGWTMMTNIARTLMVNKGDGDKKIWISEYGSPTAPGGGGNNVDEATQAAHLQQAYDLAVSYGWVAGFSYYSWQDRGGDQFNQENWFGVIRPDRSRKPAFNTFNNVTP